MPAARLRHALVAAFTLTLLLAGCSSGAAEEPSTPTSTEATFYIVRHGQTAFNVKEIVQGWSDSPLTEKGVSQAHDTAKLLDGVDLTAALSSDLGRARATAETILGDINSKVQLETSDLLREEYCGGLEGETEANFYGPILESYGLKRDAELTDYPKYLEMTTPEQRVDDIAKSDPTQTAETWPAYKKRLTAAIDLLESSAEAHGGNILVVSHSTSISHLLTLMDPTGYHGESIPNGSVTTVKFRDGVFTLEKLGQ